MADNTIGGINPSAVNGTPPPAAKKKDEVGQDEFLQLLVTQLKNQDPLEPMKGEEFAVNLAQFSQLEQLVSINQKMGESQDISSLAGYLGKEATLNDNTIQFSDGDGGLLKFNLPQDAGRVAVELLNADGSVKDVIEIGELSAGKQVVGLSGVSSENGDYEYRIVARGTDGREFEVAGRVAGVISGFVPGPQPTLLIGNREITPDQIQEVGVPTKLAGE